MKRFILLVVCILLFLSAIPAFVQDSAEPNEKFFFMMGSGRGPSDSGWRGELAVGAKMVSSVYGLLELNMAGGIGAISGDVLY